MIVSNHFAIGLSADRLPLRLTVGFQTRTPTVIQNCYALLLRESDFNMEARCLLE